MIFTIVITIFPIHIIVNSSLLLSYFLSSNLIVRPTFLFVFALYIRLHVAASPTLPTPFLMGFDSSYPPSLRYLDLCPLPFFLIHSQDRTSTLTHHPIPSIIFITSWPSTIIFITSCPSISSFRRPIVPSSLFTPHTSHSRPFLRLRVSGISASADQVRWRPLGSVPDDKRGQTEVTPNNLHRPSLAWSFLISLHAHMDT